MQEPCVAAQFRQMVEDGGEAKSLDGLSFRTWTLIARAP
jgi:hypothetical protein